MTDQELRARYGASEHGNFAVVDKIGVPHPYCITAKHVAIAADDYGGMLGTSAIERAEKQGVHCGICKGKLSFAEHEQALLVACKVAIGQEMAEENRGEFRDYLLKCKPMCEEDKFAGFAFKDAREEAGQ